MQTTVDIPPGGSESVSDRDWLNYFYAESAAVRRRLDRGLAGDEFNRCSAMSQALESVIEILESKSQCQ